MSNLTIPQGEEQAAREAATVPGMAFWAHSGPMGSTCRECAFWGWSKRFKRDENGYLEGRCCSQFKRFSQGRRGGGVPANTASCKYFDPREFPPDLVRERNIDHDGAESRKVSTSTEKFAAQAPEAAE